MSIINYFFIGTVFTFILDFILYKLKDHSLLEKVITKWDNKTRIACVLIWPIAMLIFVVTFITSCSKK